MNIGDRLRQFIEYKTNGSQVEFAEIMGWQPQYLNKLVKGGSFAYNPIVALLQKFPELDARWLILGEGDMIMKDYAESVIKKSWYGLWKSNLSCLTCPQSRFNA